MFQPTSRYYPLDTAQFTAADGRLLTYVRRRFPPPGETLPLLVEITVAQGDRLDLITARTLGDPEQFWRVADANNVLDPFDLTAEPGRTVRVPVPQA
jgi:hypothetical protein